MQFVYKWFVDLNNKSRKIGLIRAQKYVKKMKKISVIKGDWIGIKN
jgi:hypothetical protein